MALPSSVHPPPIAWRLRVHETLPSTQDLLLRHAGSGAAEGLALLARRQTGGRGREGRAWDSPAGNLHLSVLLRPPVPPREAAGWALLAAVALAEATLPLLPDPARLSLKWPNDVLLGGGKFAGVLVEAASDAATGGLAWLAIGIGANLAHAPALPDGRPTASLAAHAAPAPPPTPEAFATGLLVALGHWHAIRLRDGFDPIRAAWLARGPATDTPLTVRGAGGHPIDGRFAGIAEDGRLLLRCGEDGPIRAVAAGEVLHRAG